MKRSTRMLLMNSGKNSQSHESGQHERGQYPDRRSHEERWDGEGRYPPGREYGGMSYPMGRTGFSLSGEIGHAPEEMERKHRSMGQKASGAEYYQTAPQSWEHTGRENEYAPLTRTMAVEWTRDMDNSDGTHGPHWNMEQAKQIMQQNNIDCDPAEFYAALNMMYSDYFKVAKKYGVNESGLYAHLAKAFLDDKDAGDGKLMRYYECVVK